MSRAEESKMQASSRESAASYAPRDSSLIERWFARMPLSMWWAVAGFGLLFLLLPIVLARLEGVALTRVLVDYRAQFIYPLMIAYLLVAKHFVHRTRESITRALRPLVQLDEGEFMQAVNQGCRVSPISELIAFGVGAVLGVAINIGFEPIDPTQPFLLSHYAYLSRIVLWGFAGWAVFTSFAATRLTRTLLRQPIRVEIFNPKPFQPIGRQSLLLALVPIGAMVLGLLTSDFARADLRVEYLIVYPVIIALSVTIFLLNTQEVHRLLAATRSQRLESVQRHLARACNRLEELLSEDRDIHGVAAELNALATSKRELEAVRTWPYNIQMLRTILISAVTPPLFAVIGRVAAGIFSAGPLP
jgi:hypothetical protein